MTIFDRTDAGCVQRASNAEVAASGVMARAAAQPSTSLTPEVVSVSLTVNGTRHALILDPRTTLLDVLREVEASLPMWLLRLPVGDGTWGRGRSVSRDPPIGNRNSSMKPMTARCR